MLTYGDLQIGRRIRSLQTYEFGEITSLGNGLVEITLIESGEELTLSPEQVDSEWAGIDEATFGPVNAEGSFTYGRVSAGEGSPDGYEPTAS